MSSIYSLFVQTVDGITWKPGSTHGKKPNLYVAIHQDSAKVQRTRTVNRELAPTWDHTAKISDSSTAISLRIYHDSSIPFAPDKCLGTVDTDLSTLVKLCSSDGDAHAVRLELKGVDGKLKGRPVGTISVRLARGDEAVADQVVEPTKKDAERIGLPATTSTVMKTGGRVEQAASASGWGSVLGSVVSKLEIIVCVGDEVATIHPYVNIAWKVLTSVYKAVKNQQDTDDKLLKLVETMDEVYSFVKDVKFLREKIKSLEDKSSAIFKQTFECALFIQEYTGHGFWDRTVRNTWMNTDQKIDNLCETLLQLRDSFDGRLAVQSLFISTKVLETVESLDQTDTLKRLNPVDMNASLRTPCLPGTRKEILDSIEGRLSVPSDAGNVLWLSGVAGSGKSTISTTVSEIYRTAHRLGAFLFFDRNDQSRSHPSAVIRTMAYSLGLFEPHIGSAISAAVKADPGVVNAPLATQFKQLLLGPLRSAEGYLPGPILIILDALDECGDRQSRAPLLSLLANDVPKLPSLFRVLITSRREPDIADTFRSRFVEMNLETGLDTPSSTRDVELFLRHELSRIQHNSSLSPLWPGEKEIQTLVALSGGLFIWAATAIRFMDDYSPDNQLKILLIQDYTQGFSLDVLYDVALQSAAPWTTNRKFTKDARAVLGCVVVGREPMTDGTIDMLLSGTTKSGDVLKFLGCVIEWSPGDRARTLHASFTDYLTDPRRSGGKPWAINPKTDHYALAVGCLRILRRELRFNICGLEDSHRRNADVADMADRVAKLISPQLSYASCFWYNHIEETPFDQFIGQEVGKFLQDLFLYWLEVLSLLGRIPIAIAALRVAAHCTKGQQSDLEDFIADTIRFMAAFAPAIAQSAPHIYISAIPFAPRGSKIAKQFATWIPATLQAQSSMEGDWPSIQQILRGHTENVLSVHFSRDGSRIASGSQDGTPTMIA
ncbi:hypothetical protein FB451DRAFT_155281 [Mycena latifolia]|nr:hypothetical protein FB451DRAFT_155281 [Mycena latifolia]